MALSFQVSSVARTAAATTTAAATVVFWIWRVLKNRTIRLIRNKLRAFGITDEKAVHEWMCQWRDDTGGKMSGDLLNDEKKQAALERALADLVGNRELQQLDGIMARAARPLSAFSYLLFPPSIGTQERETLDLHAAAVLQYLRRSKPLYRAGRVFHSGKERLTLKRLLKLASYGEAWLASTVEPARPESDVAPQDRRIVHFLTRSDPQNPRPDLASMQQELAPLSHIDGILHTHMGADGDIPFITTEYIRGGTLKQWLAKDEDQRVKLNKDDVMAAVIGALAKAHAAKIFHRLICPSRILLTVPFEPGRTAVNVQVKLADFWLSRLPGQSADPVYLPPDSKRDALDRETREAKNDVFALGVMWYQFLMSDSDMDRPPYDFYDQLSDTGRSAREWIKGCLAYSEARFDDAARLHEKMAGAAKDVPTQGKPALAVLEGFYDVSDLLHDFLATV
ncbi:MAG TPA: protein kinase [Tepidisphaeraceae bacterium]|jgi:serine/threonine protein kinase|nr:protein kinase [Tepidisphaeraceae bacterium]